MELNVNSSALVELTNQLSKLNRSAFPIAVRSTLNDAAFDMKTKTLMDSSQKSFVNRQQNFFKANSRFEKASGFNVDNMQSIVGMVDDTLKGNSNYAVKDLEQQESGGTIKRKAFIPTDKARSGKNKLVRPNARLSAIQRIINVANATGKNPKEQFVKSSVFAGKGGFVLSKGILWKINSVKRLKGGNTVFNKTALYSYKPSRTVQVKPHHFMQKAGIESAQKMEAFFNIQFDRQMAKIIR